MYQDDIDDMNNNWIEDLRHYAPLTEEQAPDGFVDAVMARLENVETEPLGAEILNFETAKAPRRTGMRLRRIMPIAATAAVMMLVFAMPALKQAGTASPESMDTASFALSSDEASEELVYTDGSTPEEDFTAQAFAAPEQRADGEVFSKAQNNSDLLDNGFVVNNIFPPLRTRLSIAGGNCQTADGVADGDDFVMIYGQQSLSAGISFCVVLTGGVPPENVMPVVPNQYLITHAQLEELLALQPDGVVPEYVEDGLSPASEVGLVVIQ